MGDGDGEIGEVEMSAVMVGEATGWSFLEIARKPPVIPKPRRAPSPIARSSSLSIISKMIT